MISTELERLWELGCRRFFLSPGDWWKLGDEVKRHTPKSEDASRTILEELGHLQPMYSGPFVNMLWRGCPVLWLEGIDNL